MSDPRDAGAARIFLLKKLHELAFYLGFFGHFTFAGLFCDVTSRNA